MAVQKVKVPMSENLKARTGWMENVSQHIDASNDVQFVDEDGTTNVEVSRIQLDVAGYVCFWGMGYTSANAKRIYLEAGGFHTIGGIHYIRAADTDTSLGIHVKI